MCLEDWSWFKVKDWTRFNVPWRLNLVQSRWLNQVQCALKIEAGSKSKIEPGSMCLEDWTWFKVKDWTRFNVPCWIRKTLIGGKPVFEGWVLFPFPVLFTWVLLIGANAHWVTHGQWRRWVEGGWSNKREAVLCVRTTCSLASLALSLPLTRS